MSDRRDCEELVRRVLEAHNRGIEAVLAAYDELLDPGYEWIPAVVGGPEANSYRGKEGVRRYYEERDEAFADNRVDLISCREVAEDLLVLHIRSTARGRVSGALVDEEVGLVYQLRDSKLRRTRAFTSYAEAVTVAEKEAAVDA